MPPTENLHSTRYNITRQQHLRISHHPSACSGTASSYLVGHLSNSSSALGAFYRRIRARLGSPKAITATAHKIARIFYQMWKYGTPYKDLGADYYEQRYKERVISNIKKKAKQIGYVITFTPMTEQAVS